MIINYFATNNVRTILKCENSLHNIGVIGVVFTDRGYLNDLIFLCRGEALECQTLNVK